MFFFFSSRRRHTRCALVTGVQTCALPISCCSKSLPRPARTTPRRHRVAAWRLSQEDTPLQALHCFPAILRAFATHLGAVGAMGMGALMLFTFLCGDFTSLDTQFQRRTEQHFVRSGPPRSHLERHITDIGAVQADPDALPQVTDLVQI